MGITLKTHKMLWGRSGNLCSFPDCRKVLVVDETETDDPSVIGEEAHIVAQKEDGPRGKSMLPLDKRDMFDNLILLCRNHHKEIDDQVNKYSVDVLNGYKTQHLKYVMDNLIVNRIKIRDDERYATYIERFIELTDLHNWNNWTSWMFGVSQAIPAYIFESLQLLSDYIISRIWPNRYEQLESSLYNFKRVLNDFFQVYFVYPNERKNDKSNYSVAKFYKNYYRDEQGESYSLEEEHAALNKYRYHIALLEDLLLELTRAANYVCDAIRDSLFEGFRSEQGALLITRGDFFGSTSYRIEYRGDQRTAAPYPGLREFMIVRAERDFQAGVGVNEDYFISLPWEVDDAIEGID